MNIKPIGERLLVKPLKIEEKTSTGIILPGNENKTNPNMGEVVALGAITDISVGDTVVYKKFSGTEIKDSEEKYLIVEKEDILALLK